MLEISFDYEVLCLIAVCEWGGDVGASVFGHPFTPQLIVFPWLQVIKFVRSNGLLLCVVVFIESFV